RKTWVVSREGKGLDLALEVHVSGNRDKDYRLNVERYARLGIAEYFLFDAAERRVFGYRLPPGGRVYRPILPQNGRLPSAVLGLDLSVEGDRLRFYLGEEPLSEAEELVAMLERRVDDVTERHRAEAERAAALERELAEARAEIERLKRGG
ncbi:MAG TPA: Uma2 family endonuclease, partial [Candidatus Nanopelagicales bacterium]|nr:Uma2 family endonuclease [Candidatus Nanopelagicales bacterium]